ncbi:ABC transporter ATP-binding protein [Lysinibacter cavernae]|uniref:Branched-chain amino acid transport system ATP-binding protein n=1 Tax=Lysinibacter cavernae TaxID=1640652 RepID=A0A7X5R3E3_9MICO|nr:ABC transporter ATP-binding protein [Lysinibacter cavernae]NIH54851.1 branched-chain amino acid transport system ATP-binding protein [Lysinibacter cavernae]
MTERNVLLEVKDLKIQFGGVKAVDGLSFTVHEQEIVSVIGPNGAGKTSAFNCISGFYKPTSGNIILQGTDITGWRTANIAKAGIARTFQNLRLFPDLTVLDNVRAGMHLYGGQNFLDAILHTPRFKRNERFLTDEAHRWLDFVGYEGPRGVSVSNLAYGQQRLVEIARALARKTPLILLDEPGAGLNHGEKAQLLDLVRRIQALGMAVVLIEHDMGLVMEVSERIVVLNFGKEIADGLPADIKANPAVIEAYLGRDDDEEEAAQIAADATQFGIGTSAIRTQKPRKEGKE